MTSSINLRSLARQLEAAAGGPRQAEALIRSLVHTNKMTPDFLRDLELAIARITHDERRHLLARCLYRVLDCQRLWMPDAAQPSQTTSVFTACVPFTLMDLSLVGRNAPDRNPLEILTGPIDQAFSYGPRDLHFPEHKNFVLAVPLTHMGLVDFFAVNFMLANSHRDTPMDDHYGMLWLNFVELDIQADQVVFAFLFGVAVPDRPTAQLSLAEPFCIPMTDWSSYATDVLLRHSNALNEQYPQLGMELHALTTISEARELAAEIKFKTMFRRVREMVGRNPYEIPKTAVHSGSDIEIIEQVNAKHREFILSRT